MTRFNEQLSLRSLYLEINSIPGFANLPLGHYTAGSKKYYCHLVFADTLLPRDPPQRGPQGTSFGIWLKCHPKPPHNNLPNFVLQIGILDISPTADAKDAQRSTFAVVVTPNRQVWAIFNPNGTEPQLYNSSNWDPGFNTYDPENPSDDDPRTSQYQASYIPYIRSRGNQGKLPGFQRRCTALELAYSVEALCDSCGPDKPLGISEENSIRLPEETMLQFPRYK